MPADANPVELWITIAALILGAAVVGLMAWLEHRPRHDLNPRLIPTTLFLFVAAAVMVLALVHLMNLLGVQTGR